MPTQRDVVIVGAGPAGSAAAAALAHYGWDVLLIERDTFPRHKVCGEFLSPEAQATLRTLRLADAVAATTPAALTHATVTTQRGRTVRMPLPGAAWGVSRFGMDAALATTAQAQGVELRQGVTVKAFAKVEDGYAIQLQARLHAQADSQPTTVLARALVIACGRHSGTALPPYLTPHMRPRFVGIKAHYAALSMPSQVELYFFPGGYAGLNPVERGRANLCLLLTYDVFRRAGQSVPGTLAALAEWNPALGRRLAAGQVLEETVCTVAPVDTGRPATPWTGVACLGDTAVMLPPLCGDGMAMALRSAELCAPLAHAYLQGELTLAAWAAQYQALWHSEFSQRVRTGRLLQRLFAMPWGADALVGLGHLLPPLATYMVHATRGPLASPMHQRT